ncbi:MAG TPA: DUF4421 domain-containing protein [Cyclobacteriaceae bacterium]|nr:DUF4421 domain-containing protein [Cyclobacteriaceae bacterium]
MEHPINKNDYFSLMTRFWFVVSFLLSARAASAQQQNDGYFVSYEDLLTSRFYFSQKYTSFTYFDRVDDLTLRYVPNTTLNMGIGATYKWATVNLAYGFNFLNPDKKKNETDYLDLQCHIYRRKIIIDLLGQFYNGLHLTNDDLRDADGDYYNRSDIKIREVGASAQFIVNNKKFSYRAGFLQNDWQKKSAGTFLLGWQLILGDGKADSTIVPSKLSNIPAEAQVQKLSFIKTGPSIGYAYTLVVKKNFFFMGSGTVAISYGYNKIEGSDQSKSSSFIPDFSIKTAAGYNSEHWAITVSWTNDTANIGANSNEEIFSLHTGNLRFNVVRRFKLKRDLL